MSKAHECRGYRWEGLCGDAAAPGEEEEEVGIAVCSSVVVKQHGLGGFAYECEVTVHICWGRKTSRVSWQLVCPCRRPLGRTGIRQWGVTHCHHNMVKPTEQRLKEKLGSCSAIILPVHTCSGERAKVFKRDKKNLFTTRRWVRFGYKGTIHASYNRIHHQSAAHLHAAGLSWALGCVQEALAVQPLTAVPGGDAGAGVICPQPPRSVGQVWPPPAASPTAGAGAAAGCGQLKPCRETWKTQRHSDFQCLNQQQQRPISAATCTMLTGVWLGSQDLPSEVG